MDKKMTLRMCTAAAYADGKVQAEEKRVVFEIALRIGIEAIEIQQVWEEFNRNDRKKIELPGDEEQRRELLSDLINIIVADDIVTNAEDRFIRNVAMKFGMVQEVERRRRQCGTEIWPEYPLKNNRSKSITS
jgi:uncharacterized tellurite resistance protein B-like protein